MYQTILDALNYVAVHIPWEGLVASGILSPLLVGIKKWFSVQSERIMITLVIVSGMLVAAGNYLLHVPTSDPSIIAVQGAVVAFMTQPIYFFVVKPIWKWFATQMAKAAAYDNEVKSAAQPLSPATPAPTTDIQDFNQ